MTTHAGRAVFRDAYASALRAAHEAGAADVAATLLHRVSRERRDASHALAVGLRAEQQLPLEVRIYTSDPEHARSARAALERVRRA